jgi:hypothetical protein
MAMRATKIEDDDYDIDVLRDGARVRVPLMLMDGLQKAVALSHVTDAYALNKPGYRYPGSTLRDAAAENVELDPEALRHMRVLADPKTGPAEFEEAQRLLLKYLIANYGKVDGQARYDQLVGGGARDAAFAERGRYLKDAWRMPFRDVGPAAIQAHISGLHSMAADLKGKLDKEAADKEEADEEKTRGKTDARDAAYNARLAYLKDAYRQPFRDQMLMQAGYHPNIRLEYQRRDVRGPKEETGAGGDSEAAYQASKIAASNAWRLPSNALNLPFTPMYQRYDPGPGGGEDNERRIAEAKARIAEANDRKEQTVSVAREDYIRRTRAAWEPTAASAWRTNPKAATAVEKQAEVWRGGA